VDTDPDHDTTLTAWFKANAQLADNHDLLYQDFPSRMVWNKGTHKWSVRKKGAISIGRMYHAHPTSGEQFYLHLLLTCVSGATPFDDLYTFEGIQHPSFREACTLGVEHFSFFGFYDLKNLKKQQKTTNTNHTWKLGYPSQFSWKPGIVTSVRM
jgi:hypothetical protein